MWEAAVRGQLTKHLHCHSQITGKSFTLHRTIHVRSQERRKRSDGRWQEHAPCPRVRDPRLLGTVHLYHGALLIPCLLPVFAPTASRMCARCQVTRWHAENRSSKRERTPVSGRLTKGPLLHPYSSALEVIIEIRSYSSQFSQTPIDSSLLLCLHLFTHHSFLTGPPRFVPALLLQSSHCHNHQWWWHLRWVFLHVHWGQSRTFHVEILFLGLGNKAHLPTYSWLFHHRLQTLLPLSGHSLSKTLKAPFLHLCSLSRKSHLCSSL